MRNTIVWRFIARITIGIALAIWLCGWLDRLLNTAPWLMLSSLLYVIIGSLYLLVKEAMGKDE
ncbi:AtpZ/AtpI family protein [Alloiococcus sp. CFN-8]|uniref:AtpZ/AtpI family protein n=1 Tax=Alloiococcus sp. CFN-8 TaxID=3416081 RepID=UPI003CEA209C